MVKAHISVRILALLLVVALLIGMVGCARKQADQGSAFVQEQIPEAGEPVESPQR